jgi:hypothetical protein
MADQLADKLMRANLLEVFGERDLDKRRAAIERTYTVDVVAVDPDGQVSGYQELDAKVQQILDGAPGLEFRAEGDVYTSGDLHYLGWALGPAGADPVVRGADAAFLRDGKISRLYTFLFS